MQTTSPAMNAPSLIAWLLSFAALTTYLNVRFLRLPATIALALSSLGVSLSFLLASHAGFAWPQHAQELARQIDLGASVLLTLLFVAAMMAWVFWVLCLDVLWVYCLVFGALISPTDPVAVLDMLRRADALRALETGIAGESLFNDGIGVVAFVACHQLLGSDAAQGPDWPHFWLLLFRQVGGGLGMGAGLGWVACRLLRTVDDYNVEIFLTLALVSGGYALAAVLGFSGPLASETAT